MIGAHLNTIIDHLAIAIGGYAIALLVLDMKEQDHALGGLIQRRVRLQLDA